MKITQSDRGFRSARMTGECGSVLVAFESSLIGGYSDSCDRPGSSFVNVGSPDGMVRLNREQAASLVVCLQHWLSEKRLPAPTSEAESIQMDGKGLRRSFAEGSISVNDARATLGLPPLEG